MRDDPAAVQADDELLDNLGAGRVSDGDRVTTGLAAWRADVDAEPFPEPAAIWATPSITLPGAAEDGQAGERDLTQIVADRLTGNELLPGAWVILDATPVDDVIMLRVVTWGPSTEPSARTENRYVLQLTRENAPTP